MIGKTWPSPLKAVIDNLSHLTQNINPNFKVVSIEHYVSYKSVSITYRSETNSLRNADVLMSDYNEIISVMQNK